MSTYWSVACATTLTLGADEKVCHDTAHCELHGGYGRGAADGAGWFIQPMAYDGLGQLGLTQHHHRVAIEFPAGVGHREPTRRAVEQPDPQISLKLLDAMAQCRFRNS
jgi:hypothetical protein